MDRPMTLGELLDVLEMVASSTPVVGGVGEPESYRGYYRDLTFDTDTARPTTASQWAAEIRRNVLGEAFQGYKGGRYVMDTETRCWWAPYGMCGPAIVGISLTPEGIVPMVKHEPDAGYWP